MRGTGLPDGGLSRGVTHKRCGIPLRYAGKTRAPCAGCSSPMCDAVCCFGCTPSEKGGPVSELRWDEIDRRAVDTARVLAADAVEKVGNGHPGTAMSLAPAAYLLYQRVMRHDPADVHWPGRDRFILSAGHSSLTQYVQLYLGGFGLELDDLKSLRTWGSKTPGHPEFGHTDGVEITTGPLGQGLASSVGFAYAARYERGLFDPETPAGQSPFDHFVYVIAGDGDLQEGVTSEASSLAGHQALGNLIAIYDSNQISIEDDTNVAFTEDVAKRYESYGWHVQTVDWKKTGEYVEDVAELHAAIEAAKGETDKPSLIILRTIIGWPSPGKQNTGKIHGSALGGDELAATKKVLGFDPEQSFVVADDVIAHTREPRRARGRRARGVAGGLRRVGRREPGAQGAVGPRAGARAARGHRRRAARVRGGQGGLDPCRVRHGHQRARRGAARAVGRLGRPRRVEPHDDQEREVVHPRRVVHPRVVGRPLRSRAALRHPRARDGRDRQRHRAARPDSRVRRHVPDLQRLHAPVGASRRAHEHPVDLRVDPRLRRPRRGRTDASADRAARDAARDPELHGRAARRRERDRRGLARDAPPSRRPRRHRPHPPEHPGVPARRR